jgi:carbon-monoxide dehydrogenase large subunit
MHDSGDYAAALERALELARYDDVRRQQAVRRRRGDTPLGIGIGAYVERAGGAPESWEYGRVALAPDGTVITRTGSTSAGQGHETAWRRVVAAAFDLDPAAVVLHAGDTAEVADSVGSFASRSAQIGASAIWRSAERVRAAATDVAATILEVAAADVEVADGGFRVVGVPDTWISLAQVAHAARLQDIELTAEERYSPGAQTFPYGVHVAVVEVDLDTGLVTPRHLVVVDDVGVQLDEMIVAGQVHGSVVQGIGAALFEAVRHDAGGQPQTTTFMDYLVPAAGVGAPLTTAHLCHPAPSNPLGVKGAGEGGCIGMPPAIVNATLDALAPWGVTELQIPLTPDRVWRALRDAAG